MLTDQQIAEYDEKGFLIFPSEISAAEVELLRADLLRVAQVKSEEVFREGSGAVRSVFRVHDSQSPTNSPPFNALSTLPRILTPAQQVLRDKDLYVYHTKCNLKEAIDGAIWQWHQDYGAWERDGVPTANMTTSMLMLDEATEMGGCLYFIPGTHKLGLLDAFLDTKTTSYKLWTVPKEKMLSLIEEFGEPVPIVGKPGTVVLFHPNVVHGSGHNMSARSRWQIYTVFNPVANKPRVVENPRPEWVVSRNYTPLTIGNDSDILAQRQAAE